MNAANDTFFGNQSTTLSDLLVEDSFADNSFDFTQTAEVDPMGVPYFELNSSVSAPTPIINEDIGEPALFKKMEKIIEAVDAYSWARGEMGGLDWGFPQYNEAFEGLNTGVTLFAGGSNVGKSGMLAEIGWKVAKANSFIDENHPKKAFVLYFSLDDSCNELIPRVIAIDQRIKINAVRFPKKYSHIGELMDKRAQGIQALKDSVAHFAMIDANEGQSIEHIEKTMMEYKDMLETHFPEEYTLVAIIDNFHDISVDKKGYTEENARIDHIAGELTNLATRFDSPIICSAEFRKINVFKRPQLDDIKSSGKAVYEAKAILLCHNDVGVKGEQAQVYWEVEEQGEIVKMPIFETQIAKNKFSSFKGRVLFRFTPEISSFDELPKEEARKYIQLIAS